MGTHISDLEQEWFYYESWFLIISLPDTIISVESILPILETCNPPLYVLGTHL